MTIDASGKPGWTLLHNRLEVAGPFDSQAQAFAELLRLQPHSAEHATHHEGWKIVPPCDGCLLDDRPCPGQAAHCGRGEHCRATDAACAASTRTDPCLRCCSCGAALPDERF